jgi:Tfp pilus assembly protein PilX
MTMQAGSDHPRRGGFALPMSILLVGFIGAAVMAAFVRVGAEVRTADNQQAQQTAFALANAGLDRFLARGRLTDTTYTFADGTAAVTAILMKPAPTPTDTAVYVVRSIGTGRGGASRPAARRTVAQLAWRSAGTMQVLSSWTSLTGLYKAGSSGQITGYDKCTDDALPGVALPTGTYTQSGSGTPIQGEPEPVAEMGTQAEMAAAIKIDWHGITNPTAPAINPHVIICRPGTPNYDPSWSPCGSWPTSTQFADPTFWPTIVINGSASLPGNGKGTLIVTGNLTLGGNDQWKGIIMVGGMITDNGSGLIEGAVVSGLNVLKGETVGESSKALGTKDYIYDSCSVAAAAAGQSKLTHLQNAWVDNWSVW